MTNRTLCNVCCLPFQQTTESLSLFDAPSTMEQASVSKQPHEVQWMYKPTFTMASKASVLLCEETHKPTPLKIVNKETSIDESTSFGCGLSEEEAAPRKNDSSLPLSDDSLTPPNSGHLSSPSPPVSLSLPPFDDSDCAMLSNVSWCYTV